MSIKKSAEAISSAASQEPQFPKEAFLHIGDPANPSTWEFRIWSDLDGSISEDSLFGALAEIHQKAETGKSPALRAAAKAFGEIWKDCFKCEDVPPFISSLIRTERRKSAPTVKIEQTSTSFVVKTAQSTGTAACRKMVELEEGVFAQIDNTPDGSTQITEFRFLKSLFSVKAEVADWFKNHPQLTVKEEEAAGAKSWQESGFSHFPLSEEPQAFTLHAHFPQLPSYLKSEAGVTQTYEDLLRGGWPVVYTIRCATGAEDPGYWGFVVDSIHPESLTFASPRLGHKKWLSFAQNEPAAYVNEDGTWSPFFTVDKGLMRLHYASPTRIVAGFAGDQFKGVFKFEGSGAIWTIEKQLDPKLPDVEAYLSELWQDQSNWLIWPLKQLQKDAKGLGVIDVSTTAKHLLTYQIAKSVESAENRYTLGVAYPAERIDAHGDFITKEHLERTAWLYMMQHRGVGMFHKDGTDNSGIPVESYIYRGPDWKLPNGEVVKAGDWLLGVLWGEDAWSKIKSGDIKGYSLQGYVRGDR